MYLSRLGSGFAMTAALLWIGTTCSGNEPQETEDKKSVAEQPDSAATKLAVEEGAERSDNEQSKSSEKNQADGQTDKGVEIPLGTIWAYDMPGTLSIRKLEPESNPKNNRNLPAKEQLRLFRDSMAEQIHRSLQPPLPKGEDARNAFVVAGTGRSALKEAYAVLVDGKEPSTQFLDGKDLSLIFFVRQSSVYVNLEEVTYRGSEISVQYRVIPHRTLDLTTEFAIIPLPKLPDGKVSVKVLPPVLDQKFSTLGFGGLKPEFADRKVSGSFSFMVQ